MVLTMPATTLMFWALDSDPMSWSGQAVFFFMFGMMSLIGLATFFLGFRFLRFSKIVADTPRESIRSIALGLVNIRGKAQTDQPILSPVTHTPCCFYKVDLDQWEVHEDQKGRKTSGWEKLTCDKSRARFYLVDDTGKAVIDLSDELNEGIELGEHSERVVDSDAPHASADGITDDEIFSYINKCRLKITTDVLELIDHPLHTHFSRRFVAKKQSKPDPPDGRYRLHEFLVLPGQDYQMVGTCAENPDAKTLEDRTLICRGKTSSPFLISPDSHDGQFDLVGAPHLDMAATFRSRARGNLIVGAIVSIIGLGLLFLFIAWLLNGQVPLNARTRVPG